MDFDNAVRLQKAQALWTAEIVEIPIKSGSRQSFDLSSASQELQNSTIIGIRCEFSKVQNSAALMVRGSNASGLNLLTDELARRAKLEIETEGRKVMIPLLYLDVEGKQYLYAPVYLKGFTASKTQIIFGSPLPAGINEIVEMHFIVGDRLK